MVDQLSFDPKVCFVDGVKEVSDLHHIIPVELGGPESGQRVPLCPTCHRRVHREGEYRFRTGDQGKFVNADLYPEPAEEVRASMLASYICEAKRRFLASGKQKADESRNIIQVHMKPDELAMAHDLKRSLGFNSLERMVKTIILEKWNSIRR